MSLMQTRPQTPQAMPQNQINEVIQLAKSLQGKDPKQLVETMIQQRGIDAATLEQAKQFATQSLSMFKIH